RMVQRLTWPDTVDHYLEQIHPMLAVHAVRARVLEVVPETEHATTVLLRPNDAWSGFAPGQHVQFGVEVEGRRRIRCFSMASSARRDDGRFTVSVKAHPDGYVSQHLKRGLQPGTTVFLSEAEGDFVLPSDIPDGL